MSITYDNVTNAKGKLTKVDSSVSTTEYTAFDILGRVTGHKQTTDGNQYTTAYTYNLSGALIEQTYPSGRVVKNELDNNGDLSMVQSKKNASTGYWNYAQNFTYNAAGAVTSMQLGNGKWESTQFNSRLQPTQIALGTLQNGADKLKLDYSYGTTNNNGNVLSQTITVPTVGANTGFTATQTYTYDSLNRLTQATETIAGNQSWKQTFGYDRFGNRTSISDYLGNALTNDQTPQVDAANNRFTTASGFTYDLSGNVITDNENRSFIYDAENKQKEVKDVNNITIGQYLYNGDGLRIKKVTASETTIFVYDVANKLVAEYSTQLEQTPQVSYLTMDNLSSTRIITNKNGETINRRDFKPFGEEIARTQYGQDNIDDKFATYKRDNETGLDFAQARMHNSNHGRFSSADPLLASASRQTPQSWNRYSYVVSNPLKYVDPSGMIWGSRVRNGQEEFCFQKGAGVCKGFTKYTGDGILTDPSINGRRLGYAIRLNDDGTTERVVPVSVSGIDRLQWMSEKDAEAIGGISSGALCSLTGGLACPNVGDKDIAGNVKVAADVVQYAFIIKSLLKAGLSLGAIAMALRKDPEAVSSLAAKVIGEGCYTTGECKVAATALMKEFEKNGIKGTLVRLKSPNGEALVKAGNYTEEIATANSEGHFGVQVGDMVYEMNSPTGTPVTKWAKGYEYAPRTSPTSIANPIMEVVPPQ